MPNQGTSVPAPPPPQSGGSFLGAGNRQPRWDDTIDWADIIPNKWMTVRFIGTMKLVGSRWFESKRGKRFPMLVEFYDPATREVDANRDIVEREFDPKNSPSEKIQGLQLRQSGLACAIIREAQKIGNVTGDPEWRFWRPFRLPMSVVIALQKHSNNNLVEWEGKQVPVDIADPYYGKDINIFYDPKGATPSDKYQVQAVGLPQSQTDGVGVIHPLTEEEQACINELPDFDTLIRYPTEKDIKQALQMGNYYDELKNMGSAQAQQVQGQVLPQTPWWRWSTCIRPLLL